MESRHTLRLFLPEDAVEFPTLTQYGVTGEKVPQPAFVGVSGGKLVACGGIVTLRPGVGEAWGILKYRGNGHDLWFARASRDLMDDMMRSGKYRRIQATIKDVPELHRYMTFLRFTAEGRLRAYGQDGEDQWMYARVR